MPFAPNYTPTTGFATDETNQAAGRSTVKTVSLDTELANISSSILALNTNIKLLQRDDGKPKDFLIEPYALSEQTRALVAAGGRPRGSWLPNTAYAVGDATVLNNIALLCVIPHTSSNTIDYDLWMGISGDGSASASAAAAAASAASIVGDKDSAAASAVSAASSASTASTHANSASSSAASATNSAASALASKVATDLNVIAAANSAAAVEAAASSAMTAAENAINVVRDTAITSAIDGILNEADLIEAAAIANIQSSQAGVIEYVDRAFAPLVTFSSIYTPTGWNMGSIAPSTPFANEGATRRASLAVGSGSFNFGTLT